MPDCRDCVYYRETSLFELCDHAASAYTVAGKADVHTVGHMRSRSCGERAINFTQKEAGLEPARSVVTLR